MYNAKIKSYGEIDHNKHVTNVTHLASNRILPVFDIACEEMGKRPKSDSAVKEMIDGCFAAAFSILSAEIDFGKVTIEEAKIWFDGWRDDMERLHNVPEFNLVVIKF